LLALGGSSIPYATINGILLPRGTTLVGDYAGLIPATLRGIQTMFLGCHDLDRRGVWVQMTVRGKISLKPAYPSLGMFHDLFGNPGGRWIIRQINPAGHLLCLTEIELRDPQAESGQDVIFARLSV
jgi:hypothetical protein